MLYKELFVNSTCSFSDYMYMYILHLYFSNIYAMSCSRVFFSCITGLLQIVFLISSLNLFLTDFFLTVLRYSRTADLISHQFTEPGLYHYVYNMADLSQLRGYVMVQPKPTEHVVGIDNGRFKPGGTLNFLKVAIFK